MFRERDQSARVSADVAPITGADALVPGERASRWLRALVFGIVGLYALFLAVTAGSVGPTDQDQFLVFHELQYWNAMLFGLSKQWAPIMCSGMSLADEPQIPFMSLSMALGYVLGPFWGIKLATVTYLAIGWYGAYLYASLWLQPPLQRSLAAALFIGNGFFFCRLGVGHADFMPFLILPLVLWTLHRNGAWRGLAAGPAGVIAPLLSLACVAAAMSLTVDGSPVAAIHLWFWIGIYAIVLAWTRRRFAPIVLLGGAVVLAGLLDAGYLWPMLRAQSEAPRLTPDRFTNPLNILWYAVVPMRGEVMSDNGHGHELNIFIGPVIAWAIWRHRHWLGSGVPAALRIPLLVVSAIAIVMGTGSLVRFGVPRWLSLFDALRSLPGFRSLGITGRYWGFLALPLSLLGAAALWRFAAEERPPRALALWMGALLFLQLGFQGETMFGQWLGTDRYHPVPWQGRFQRGPEAVTYVSRPKDVSQGRFLSPIQGVVNCYDMDDFQRASMIPGAGLLRASSSPGGSAVFTRWDEIQLGGTPVDVGGGVAPRSVRWTLNQAYHRFWTMPGCSTERSATGNLIADCPTDLLPHPPPLTFYDSLSAIAARVSVAAWRLWLAGVAACLVALWMTRGRLPRVTGTAGDFEHGGRAAGTD